MNESWAPLAPLSVVARHQVNGRMKVLKVLICRVESRSSAFVSVRQSIICCRFPFPLLSDRLSTSILTFIHHPTKLKCVLVDSCHCFQHLVTFTSSALRSSSVRHLKLPRLSYFHPTSYLTLVFSNYFLLSTGCLCAIVWFRIKIRRKY